MTELAQIANAIEAALFSSERPLSVRDLQILFDQKTDKGIIQAALEELSADYADRGVELVEVAGGFRFSDEGGARPGVAHTS